MHYKIKKIAKYFTKYSVDGIEKARLSQKNPNKLMFGFFYF